MIAKGTFIGVQTFSTKINTRVAALAYHVFLIEELSLVDANTLTIDYCCILNWSTLNTFS